MRVDTLIMDGLSVTDLAVSIALRRPSRSVLPSATCCTCHPRAAKRADTSSVNEMSVWPSIEILLSSYMTMSLPSPQCPARDAASVEMPSMLQPSPIMQ